MTKVMKNKFFPQGSSPFIKNVRVQMEEQSLSHINGDVEGSGTGNLQNPPEICSHN